MIPVRTTPTSEDLEQRVQHLLQRWRAETEYLSSSTRITGHPAYQELIALGSPALPFLLRDLEQTSDGHLSLALASITGAHPVSPEERGQIARVAAAWLCWARETGLQW
jgi:hypothetical protein